MRLPFFPRRSPHPRALALLAASLFSVLGPVPSSPSETLVALDGVRVAPGSLPLELPSPAGAYLLDFRRGQRLVVTGEAAFTASIHRADGSGGNTGVPLHVLESAPGAKATGGERAANAERATFEPDRDGTYRLEFAPKTGPGSSSHPGGPIRISAEPVLGFPVADRASTRLVSFFGDGRDDGARAHDGIDIKAARGTPVLAPADGVVRKVGSTERGGLVVSVWDPVRKVSYYYAHLETQSVRTGQQVKAGDELGTVGNSGNAIGTFPHLHFAVYTDRWRAIDPLPWVYDFTR